MNAIRWIAAGWLWMMIGFAVPAQADTLDLRQDYLESAAPQRPFDADHWQTLTEDLDYSEEVEEPEPSERERRSRTTSPAFRITSGFGQVLFYILIIVVLAGLLVWLMGSGLFLSNKSIPASATDYSLEDLDEHFKESDLERLLRLALEDGNYRMALRVHFLMAVKELDLRQLILWKKDKTNYDYVVEMGAHPAARNFQELALIFDYVWYGEQPIGEPLYQTLQQKFRAFVKQLQSPTTA